MLRRDLILGAFAPRHLDLRQVAAVHVAISESDRGRRPVWGRIGGSEPEHRSAAALAGQLKAFLPQVGLETFRFQAHRPLEWQVKLEDRLLETAMPAPMEARFPERPFTAPLAPVLPDGDWSGVAGKWAFVHSQATASTAQNIVREKLLYQRAVSSGAAGLLFSIHTPRTRRWTSVVPVDKPYAVKDERYPGGLRPIPCFSVDAVDGEMAAAAAGAGVSYSARYAAAAAHEGRNVAGYLPGSGDGAAAGIMCHIDSFFSGACDNASGMAAMVGLARELSSVPKKARRRDFYFLGLSAHHDEAAGMRDWVARDAARFSRVRELFLLEHVDALDSEEGRSVGWPMPLNHNRVAYLGSQGWPEVRALLPRLMPESGLMPAAPPMQDACIADLFVTCGRVRSFCLMNAPPFYHTNHDTLDRISDAGIQRAVDFHILLLRGLGLA